MFNQAHKHILWIAWRQLIAPKNRNLSFMTKVSVLGVTIGVATLTIVLSVMGGLEGNLRKKMFKGMPHLELFAEKAFLGFSLEGVPLDGFEKNPQFLDVEPFIQTDVVIKKEKKLAPITLFGLDPQKGGRPWGFADHMIEGRVASIGDPLFEEDGVTLSVLPGIILGESLASRLGVRYGEVISLLNPQIGVGTVLSGEKGASLFQVRGSFYTGLPRYDAKFALVVLDDARKFMLDYDSSLDDENYVTGLGLTVVNPEDVEDYKASLERELSLKARTWKEANKSLIFALKLEKYTMAAILFLIVLVAAFSISGTLMMSVFYKRSQISILSSLGLDKKSVLWLHLTHGLTIGVVGSFLGLLLGVSFCAFLDSDLPFRVLPSFLSTYLSFLPVKFLQTEYVFIGISASLLSLLASLYPALVASRQSPTEGLRYL